MATQYWTFPQEPAPAAFAAAVMRRAVPSILGLGSTRSCCVRWCCCWQTGAIRTPAFDCASALVWLRLPPLAHARARPPPRREGGAGCLLLVGRPLDRRYRGHHAALRPLDGVHLVADLLDGVLHRL